MPIFRSLSIVMVGAILLNAMAPALAYAATYLQGAEVNANTLIQDAYVVVTYYDSKGKQKSEKGWIDAIDETTFRIRSGALFGKKAIAYDKVLSVIMGGEATPRGKQINEVDRFIREMEKREARALETEEAAIQRFNQKVVTIISRGQIDSSKITRGWYAQVIYTSQETATGRIVNKTASSIILFPNKQQGRKIAYNTIDVAQKNIAYDTIDTLVIAKQWRDIKRYREIGAKYNAKVRVHVPSIQKKRMVGELVKMTQDTLVIHSGRTFFQVPSSSISNFEVSIGRYRNTDKGFKIGLAAGAVIIGLTSISTYKEKKRIDQRSGDTSLSYYTLHIATLVGYSAGAFVCLLSTLIGATIKSDKWVEVPPDRLNLSINPHLQTGFVPRLRLIFDSGTELTTMFTYFDRINLWHE